MEESELNYIKNTILFALNKGDFNDSYMETFYSCAINSTNMIDREIIKIHTKK